MRIYKREAFMKLPAGTVYSKIEPWIFGELCVKDDTLVGDDGVNTDFFFRHLIQPDAGGSAERMRRLEEMLKDGACYPMSTGTERDGCYDDGDVFLVYEKDDLKELIRLCEAACKL